MKYGKSNIQGLSIIEVMIGIFIFSLGISAIFMVIVSTLKVNTYNKNFIVASNLAREQIELIRNIRDTNYKKLQKWDTRNPYNPNFSELFTDTTKLYKIQNNFDSEEILVNLGTTVADFKSALEDSSVVSEEQYQLCLDSNKRYVYCVFGGSPIGGLTESHFYRYVEIKQLTNGGGTIVDKAFKVRSKVYWNQKGVHNTEIDTIITDWERL